MSDAAAPASPLAKFFKAAAKVEPGETAAVVSGFFLFFFVLGSYFAVRPLRETIATGLGADYVADLWLYTAGFSIAIVPVYGWLVGKVRRAVLLPCIYGLVAVILAGIGALMSGGTNVDRTVGAFFYVWISVLNLMLVSVFWSFLLEMFSREQTKRLFGLVAGGGTLGALAGPLATSMFARTLGDSGILYLGAAGFVGAIVCQRILLGSWQPAGDAGNVTAKGKGVGGNPFAGITIVLGSRYLLGIALFVVLLSAANTLLYFEQLRIVSATYPDRAARTQVFANIDFVVQSLTLITQLFLTGRIATKFGVRSLLTFVPIAMVLGFLVLAAVNVFSVFAVIFVARRWGEYAFIRPGREMLFSSLSTETKYKAKSFIDVPVYRAADYVGAQAKTAVDAITASPVVSLVVGAALAAGWAVIGWWLGSRQDENDTDARASSAQPVTAAAE